MTAITDLLNNDVVRRVLAKHYRAGIAEAVEAYEESAADEDAVTGALGQALHGQGAIVLDDKIVGWKTRYRKLRGRGKNAPEKRFGADGIFEVELEQDGILSRKSLPFQAKNDAAGYGSADLMDQASKLAKFPGGGIVVNYRPDGYSAVDAKSVANRDASRHTERSLGDMLSDEFLACKCGSTAYFFEPALKGIVLVQGPLLLQRRWSPAHRIRTTLIVRPNR